MEAVGPPKDWAFWGEAPQGRWSRTSLKGLPVPVPTRQLPGLATFTELVWAVCQSQDQTETCCSASWPLPRRLATPQRAACEGRKQAGLLSPALSQPLGPQGCGGRGGNRRRAQDTARPCTPHKASLTKGQQPTGQGPPLWRFGLPGRERSCAHKCVPMTDGGGLGWLRPTHTASSVARSRGAAGDLIPPSTRHSIVLWVHLKQKGFPFARGHDVPTIGKK